MRALALTLILLLASAAAAQTHPAQNRSLVFWKMSRKSVDMLLQAVPQPDAARLAQLKQTFNDLQCKAPRLREQPAPGGTSLTCLLPGTSPKAGTFLFLAHYEHEGPGQSAIENWTGALMLPFLYHALAAMPHRHTFLFAEVSGQSGARAFFGSLNSVQHRSIVGVVALDALGLGPAQFYINPNDTYSYYAWRWLYRPLLQAAADQRVPAPDNIVPGGWFKVDAARRFRHHNIPTILIDSVSFAARQVPGSERDTATAIDHDAYFQTLILLSDYAAELDLPPPK